MSELPCRARCGCLLFAALCLSTCNQPVPQPPQVTTAPVPTASSNIDHRADHIRDLIDSLAAIDTPELGFSGTLSGSSFAPLPDQLHIGSLLFNTTHELGESAALKELVALGPDALPFLLQALVDKTPTQLTIRDDGIIGGMSFKRELPINPEIPAEADAARSLHAMDERRIRNPDKNAYTLSIGDICFVAIGQIVGRRYQAVRYQPSGCIVINSPVHDPELCAKVRDLWSSTNSRQKLLESLRADFASETGVFQCQAAMRLLYYFPRESAAPIAARLEKFDVQKDAGADASFRRLAANGVRSDEFIQAVAWSSDPAVKAALVNLFKRAGDTPSLLAAVPAIDDKDLLCQRLDAHLAAIPADADPDNDGYLILVAFLDRAPEAAQEEFNRYLKTGGIHRRRNACSVLRGRHVPWNVEILGPFLSDTRSTGSYYDLDSKGDEPRVPIRVCDEAAFALTTTHADLAFTPTNDLEARDRQIAAMRAALDKTP